MVTLGPNTTTGNTVAGNTVAGNTVAGNSFAGNTVAGNATGAVLNAGLIERQEAAVELVSSGFRGLDALLPAGGIRRGRVYCFVTDSLEQGSPKQRCSATHAAAAGPSGSGALTLACAVACRLAAAPSVAGTIVIVDRGTSSSWGGGFHPPAVMPWVSMPWGAQHRDGRARRGSDDPPPLIIARPSCDDDEIWTIDQALRCPGVAAVVAWPSVIRSRSAGSWSVVMRRWQLAARSSGAVALFVQPAAARREPSWAEARIAVSPCISGVGASGVGASAGGGLLERRLRLELVGGNWAARVSGGGSSVQRAVEIVFDLAHGCERPARDTARHDTARHDTARHDTARHDTARHDTAWGDTARIDTTRLASAAGGVRVSAAGGGWHEEKRRVAT